ncbi:histidine acid phosphatase family protein [Xylaria intraflava]|nr:histidine acid phosphatase family protein [Xylaria intraflava]
MALWILSALARIGSGDGVDLSWYPPRESVVNDLSAALHGRGTDGIRFDDGGVRDGDGVNWCDMPRVTLGDYVVAPLGFELRYVEVIQRHHKRTPYASNGFPVEQYRWDCDDEGLYTYGEEFANPDTKPAQAFWKGYVSPVNPFVPAGWVGTCQFPQLTAAGLDDAYAHGQDLYAVYHDLLGFLPSRDENWRDRVAYRVTQNVITSQVAGMLIGGTWGTTDAIPVLIQATGVDSLEPQYACAAGSALFAEIQSANDTRWQAHLDGAAGIYAALDFISGVSPSDAGFHASFDHYYDNLSARQCHGKPLPCRLVDGVASGTCVNQTLADAVYRLGQWEYSHVYRDAPRSLDASVASYGVWIAELAAHLRSVIAGDETRLYFHNVAHDGSVSRLLSVLQVDVMIWPGMGSEVVFELYQRAPSLARGVLFGQSLLGQSGYYVRVLYGGRTLRSSNPSLGVMDMLPVETLLAYFDGLVGRDASLVKGKCNGTIKT